MFGKGGLGGLMKQAQQMQEKMQKMQEEIAQLEVTGESGAGFSKNQRLMVRTNCRRIEIDPSLMEDDKEMLEDLVKKGYLTYEYPKQLIGKKRVEDTSLEKGYNIVAGKLSFEFTKILSPFEVTPTLVATDVHKMAVPLHNGYRTLTVKEGLRLFGFPDNYNLEFLKKSEAFDLLGNTVCIPVIKAVSKKLLESHYESNKLI